MGHVTSLQTLISMWMSLNRLTENEELCMGIEFYPGVNETRQDLA